MYYLFKMGSFMLVDAVEEKLWSKWYCVILWFSTKNSMSKIQIFNNFASYICINIFTPDDPQRWNKTIIDSWDIAVYEIINFKMKNQTFTHIWGPGTSENKIKNRILLVPRPLENFHSYILGYKPFSHTPHYTSFLNWAHMCQ